MLYNISIDGRVKRFNAVKTEWGFSRLLPLTEFKDTSKGYLSVHGNSCKFGVEVFVIKSEGKGECFSILDNPNKNQFTWEIGKFSDLPEAGHFSDEFTIGDNKWYVVYYTSTLHLCSAKKNLMFELLSAGFMQEVTPLSQRCSKGEGKISISFSLPTRLPKNFIRKQNVCRIQATNKRCKQL